jgi:hypothetical protein
MTANAPDGSPPSSYPPCTSKAQDRCTQTGKMMKGGRHMAKAHHHMKKPMTSDPAAAPSAAPAPGA